MVSVFIVGLPKSGTTTLNRAFNMSKLKSAHWRIDGQFVGQLITAADAAGQDPLRDFSEFYAITQADVSQLPKNKGICHWPQMDFALLDRIRTHHPNIKFVLNYRDPVRTEKSMRKWFNMVERLTVNDIPNLPVGVGAKKGELAHWIRLHHQRIREKFKGDPNFFEYDIENPNAKEELEKFLGIDFKWWGVANKGQSQLQIYRYRLKKRLIRYRRKLSVF